MKRIDTIRVIRWLDENKAIAERNPASALVRMIKEQTGIVVSSDEAMASIRKDAGIIPKGYQGANAGKISFAVHMVELEDRIAKIEKWLKDRAGDIETLRAGGYHL